MKIEEHVPLAPLTTFNIGGNARYFASAQSEEDVHEALAFAHEKSLPFFVLGGGSNILVADDGFSGLVLQIGMQQSVTHDDGKHALLAVGAGVVWDDFVARAVAQGYAGIECLSGVPGTVGGAVVANIGAYGQECSDTFVSAEVIDIQNKDLRVQTFTKASCDFSYHKSHFSTHPGQYVVISVTFAFAKQTTVQPSYRDSRFNITELVAKNGREPSLVEVRDEVLRVRAEKGVLSSSYHSAGSFFHMPFVSREKYEEIQEQAIVLDAEKELRLRPWAWEQADGTYKIAPAFLLEYTKFQKGYTQGAVGISPKHTLSVIASAGACASDVAKLACTMHDAVQKIFSLSLEREVKYIGDVEK